ncbi:MAG: DUF481 domain-containing protein [Bacteroidetes bacterium]|nr:DUF481 domain-containing protein [Bacteroidota bacterium]
MHIASTGSINNTESSASYLLNNAVNFSMKKKHSLLDFNNSWVYGAQQTGLTNNDVSSLLDFNIYPASRRFYYWGLASYLSSFSLKINNQYQAGLGLAYNILDKQPISLNVSDGIVYDQSDIYLQDSVRDRYNTFRNSLRVMLTMRYRDLIAFHGTAFYQNSFSLSTDYIVKADLGLDFKVYRWLHFTTAFIYNRFNRTQRENVLFTYGLSVVRYF